MSTASEKLKRLNFQPIVYADGDFQFHDGYSKESLLPLLAALPQIVAVIEAAERVDTEFASGILLEEAVQALDEALS